MVIHSRDKALIQESCLVVVFWSDKQEQVRKTVEKKFLAKLLKVARSIIGSLEGDSGVELVRTCKMMVSIRALATPFH